MLTSLAGGLWGTVGVASSLMHVGGALDPAVSGLVRTALGAASLLGAAAMLRVPWGAGPLPLRLVALFGFAGAVFQTCLFAAFVEAGVTITVAVTVCAPVALVAAWDAAWNRTWPEPGALVAIVLASGGVVLAVGGGAVVGLAGEVGARGAALLAVASVAFAVVAASARALGGRLHPLRGAGLGLSATATALAVIVLLRRDAAMAPLGALPVRDLAILAYVGIVATGVAYLSFVLGLALSRSASTGLVATLIEPGVAALLAAAVLQERLAPSEALGCVLMVAAMLVLLRAEKKPTACKASDMNERNGRWRLN
jgi:DME family drug/metabolite transporter